MISSTDKTKVITTLHNVLGSCATLKHNELAFYCPFCNHHKQKLQVNTETQKWHCWNCNSGGKKLSSLLWKLDVDQQTIKMIKSIYGDTDYNPKTSYNDAKVFIHLPKEFISLAEQPKGNFNPEYNQAISYLKKRGIGLKEIIKYNIGYCIEGKYARRLILPSYSEDGSLNYFISRAYYDNNPIKYQNPSISKNIVCLDSHINWNEDIILCEGIFDAVAIRRNAIPLLGKFPSRSLVEKIFLKGAKNITIALDNDAKSDALKIADYFRKQGLVVKMMYLKDKDASEMGYEKFYEELKNSKEFSSDEFLLNKILDL